MLLLVLMFGVKINLKPQCKFGLKLGLERTLLQAVRKTHPKLALMWIGNMGSDKNK